MRDAIAPPLCISQKPCETIANQMSFFFHHHHHQNQQPKKDIHELVPEVRQLLNEDVNADLSDDDVKRFLTARALDVTKAVKMIEKWHNWYNEPFTNFDIAPSLRTLRPRDITTLSTDDKENRWGEIYACSNLGVDKSGRPIYWEKCGQAAHEWSKLTKIFTLDELYLRHIGQQNVMFQRFIKASAKTGHLIDKQVVVMDLKHIPFSPDWSAMRTVQRIAETDQEYYPETLGTILVINAPIYFTCIWAVIKPWLDALIVEKIHIVGSNYLPVLKEFINEDQIPEEYGGKRANFAWRLPESYQD